MNAIIRAVGVSFLLAVMTLPAMAQQLKPPPPDPITIAQGQIRQKDFAGAAATLQGFLRSTTGDSRIPAAKTMLLSAVQSQAKEQEAKQPLEAARALIAAAALPAMAEHRDTLRTAATPLLQKAFDAAVGKKDAAAVVAVCTEHAAAFPEATPLADEAAVRQWRIKSLEKTRKTGRIEHIIEEVRQLRKSGATDEELKAADLDLSQLSLKLAQQMFDRGWYQECTGTIVDELQAKTTQPPDLKRSLNQLLEKSLLAYVAACAQLGNYTMLKDAIELYEIPENASADKSKLNKYKTVLEKIIIQNPRELRFDGLVTGDAKWIDDGGGFTGGKEVKEVVVGDRNKDTAVKGTVTVQAGFVMDGGLIRCQRGKITFAGTAEKPIILRNVTIECDYVGTISAQFTIFQNCKFRKSGGTYWLGGYSSKWEFDDCLLLASRFNRLSKTDYGIRMQRCTFVKCYFPDRYLADDPGRDANPIYRGHWNKLSENTFYSCKVLPSVVWGSQGSAFYDCVVGGNSTLTSATDVDVQLAIPTDDAAFVRSLAERTSTNAAGRVKYAPTMIDRTPRPSPLWRWLPPKPAEASDAEGDADPKDGGGAQ